MGFGLFEKGYFFEVCMVRGILIVFAFVVGLVLSACGNNNMEKPANFDNSDAVKFKTGKSTGEGRAVVVKEYNEKDELVEKKQDQIFIDNPVFDINWGENENDVKEISVSGKIATYKNGKETLEDVVFKGKFDAEGFAVLKPVNSNIISLAVARCIDLCETVVTDIMVKEEVNGKIQSKKQQIEFVDTQKSEIQQAPQQEKTEVIPETAGLLNSAKMTQKKTDSKNTPKTSAATTTKETNAVKTSVPPSTEEEDEADLAESEFEMEEPGVPSAIPFLITDEMMDNRDKENIQVTEFQEAGLFPIDLGGAYTGIAQGFYSRGSLAKGTSIAEKGDGFKSIRNDNIYYGSGLLIKTIEETGKLFAKMFPNQLFEVNDLSRKGGGRVKPHASHQNGLDADILLPKLPNGEVDYAKAWTIVKSSVSLGYVDIIILEPAKIEAMCKYLKSSNEKDYSQAFSKMYRDTAVKKKNKRTGKFYWKYGHTKHMHMRLKCTPHNKGCRGATYTQSKRGVCQ